MSVEVRGLQELIDQLHKMGGAVNKVGGKALRDAGDVVKEAQKKEAEKTHDKYSEEIGYKQIKRFPVRGKREGRKTIDIGIKSSRNNSKSGSRNSDWDKQKGLYFNHYGFVHNRSGKYITGSRWMDKAFEKSQDEAYEKIKKTLIKEMGL